mmetsp:Transcript_19409/g.51859  ORF Transcript_19409/g.51859 Transcript_19409/m.51859 type:complete len:295 (+) Transcript_19409:127-1011(+)
MDLGIFAEEVLEAVAGICGDTIVETHEQARHVLDALCQRPGTNTRELAAVFGLTHEQLARTREVSRLKSEGATAERTRWEADPVWANLCASDAVYTWNVLIERINQAAHWREEFRELANAEGDEDGGLSGGEEAENASIAGSDTMSVRAQDGVVAEVSAKTRAKARDLLAKHLDIAPEGLRGHLTRRLDDEIFEKCPADKDYRHCARSITANLRRNPMLAAGYATGRVPPQWLILADEEALAPRMRQLQRRVLRVESLKEAREDEDTAGLRRKMWQVAKATDLAPPPPNEDPLG